MESIAISAAASMSVKAVSLEDKGNCISIAFDDNIVLLNKPQVAMIEIIKGDTVRIDMGGASTSSIFLKYTDVTAPVVRNAVQLRDVLNKMLTAAAQSGSGDDGDCACATLIQQTNDGIANVVSVITDSNTKADASLQVLNNVASGITSLNQMNTDIGANHYQQLIDLTNETIKVGTNTGVSVDKLDNIVQSSANTAANVLATNDVLSFNHASTLQTLASLKSELTSVRTTVGAGNDLLTTLNQNNASVINNGTNGNQYLASLDTKFGSNAFLGNMSRKLKTITVQPPISTVAYAAGQVIGGVMTLTAALRAATMSGTWMGVQVMEKSTQKAPMDIVLFTSMPTAANFAEKTLPVWTNDYDKVIGIQNIVAANYSTLSTSSGACLGNMSKRVTSTTGNLYAVAICNGTPTYASVSHLYFTFYFEQD